jgi:hypothetical protein
MAAPALVADEPELILLEPEDVAGLWPSLRPFVERAIPRSHGRLTAQELLAGAVQGRYGIAIVYEEGRGILSVGALQVLTFPEKAVLSVFMYSGERRRLMHLWPIVEQRAREMGCSEVQISGPRAWGRIFPDFKEAFTTYTKEV